MSAQESLFAGHVAVCDPQSGEWHRAALRAGWWLARGERAQPARTPDQVVVSDDGSKVLTLLSAVSEGHLVVGTVPLTEWPGKERGLAPQFGRADEATAPLAAARLTERAARLM